MQALTHYTTSDFDYYYADLKRLPRLTKEERQQLTHSATQRDSQAINRLIEGHLSLVTRIALERCPPTHYYQLPDIIGEVALTLVKAAHRYDFEGEGKFTCYAMACADGAVKRTISDHRLLHIPSSTLSRAKQQGKEEQLYQLHPLSLDEQMIWYNTDELEEPPAAP